MSVVFDFLASLLQIYVIILVARALLSWFPAPPGSGLSRVVRVLDQLTEPVLRPVRRVVHPVGVGGAMVDLSIIIVVVVLEAVVIPLLRG